MTQIVFIAEAREMWIAHVVTNDISSAYIMNLDQYLDKAINEENVVASAALELFRELTYLPAKFVESILVTVRLLKCVWDMTNDILDEYPDIKHNEIHIKVF